MGYVDEDNPWAAQLVPVGCADCRQIVMNRPGEQVFAVAPADGGGWQEWSAALLRLVERIGDEPTKALIVTQEAFTQRYVQVMIGHGIAHTEASSNVYLDGDSVLTDEHEELLDMLAWQPPSLDHDEPSRLPANWSLPLIHGNWPFLVEMLMAVIVGVFGFSEHVPIEVRTFGVDEPCRSCSWPDES
jgi:hypothetical protein